MSRWRAASLIAVHLLMIGHFMHWWYSGRTVGPVEPSEAMYTFRDGAVNPGLIFLAAAILATVVFGRFVCGWGCHLVAYQDLTLWVLKRLHLRPKPFRSRVLVFIPLSAALYMFGYPIFRRYVDSYYYGARVEPYAWHLTETGFWDTFPGPIGAVLTILFAGVAIVYFLGPKGFCTFACPYGALFGFADKFSKGRIRVTDACEGCGHCTATCTSNVKVAEEVRLYGMVVDPGCMKCLDCVNVCPNDALYFGFGSASIGSRPRALRPPSRYDLSWAEEILALAVFGLFLLSYRGIYGGRIPFLFALAVAGIGTFVVMKAVKLLHQRNVSVQKFRLKVAGRLRPIGAAHALGVVLLIGLTAHSAFWQYHDFRGHRFFNQSPPAVFGWQHDPAYFHRTTDRQRAAVTAGLRHLEASERWGILDAVDNLGELAWLYLHAGRPREAIERINRVISQDPDNAAAHLQLATAETSQRNFDAAESAFRIARRLAEAERQGIRRKLGDADHPLSSKIATEWAAFLEAHGRGPEAAEAHAAAVELDRSSPLARMARGEFLMRTGRVDEARRILIEAVRLDRSIDRTRHALSFSSRMDHQDFAAALIDYEMAHARDPDILVFLRNRAYVLARLGRFAESLSAYRQALDDHPDAADIRADYAAILVAARNPTAAIREYRSVLNARPEDADTAIKLGLLLEQAGRPTDARACFDVAVRHGPPPIRTAAQAALLRLEPAGKP